jgi:hypothetical protein
VFLDKISKGFSHQITMQIKYSSFGFKYKIFGDLGRGGYAAPTPRLPHLKIVRATKEAAAVLQK